MLATVPSATVIGVDGRPVFVEVHVSKGLPGFSIVGLPDASCRESRDRVRAALLSAEQSWPQKRVTVNLAPTAVRKSGSALDLAIAVGVLVASGEVPAAAISPDGPLGVPGVIGELGLDGTVRPVVGAVPLVDSLADGVVVVPRANAREAAVVGRHRVVPVADLRELVAVLRGDAPVPDCPAAPDGPPEVPGPDLAEVRGQPVARLAVEVAAAGGHHLLMMGPPGAGKTMLAVRVPGLLRDLDHATALEATRIHSAAGCSLPPSGLIRRPPFRSPHHSATPVALIGGGTQAMRPGEVSLAHGGVLFLDELGEFAPMALECLRQPLEEGRVRVSRAHASVEFPAATLLVAASNPCPCGAGSPTGCRCSDRALFRYARRFSGPLLDRFDLRLRLSPVGGSELLEEGSGEPTSVVRERVAGVRRRSVSRGVRANRELSGAALRRHIRLDPGARAMLESAMAQGRLSARGAERVLTVALTLDDLRQGEGALDTATVAQALALRVEIAPGMAVAS